MLALGEKVGREQMPHDLPCGVLDVQGDVAVFRHVEIDIGKALHLFLFEQPGPIDCRNTIMHRHLEFAVVGQPHQLRLDLATRREGAVAPAVHGHEREDAVGSDARTEEILERDAELGAGVEIRLDREGDAVAGLWHEAAVGHRLPRDRDLLHVALGVGIGQKHLLAAERLGVGDLLVAAGLFLTWESQVDHVLGIAVAPRGHPADLLAPHAAPRIGFFGLENDPQLQAVAREALVAGDRAGMAHRRLVDPARQDVEVVRVIHGVNPDRHLVAQVFRVTADEDPAGEIPVFGLAVDGDLARDGQDADPEVFGFGGTGAGCPDGRGNEDQKQGNGQAVWLHDGGERGSWEADDLTSHENLA